MAESFTEAVARVRGSRRARRSLWKQGVLWWKLHAVQFLMYLRFYSSSSSEEVWNCARRLGKTYLLVILAVECCLRKPGARVAFAALVASDIEEIIQPMLEEIFRDAPPGLRLVQVGDRSQRGVRCRWSKGRIEFPNGAVLKIAGCDSQRYNRLRGRGVDLWLVDEAGFLAPATLPKVVDDVLRPQTWTTGGRGVIASSPPDTPAHPFERRYLLAKKDGRSAHYTIDDNPLINTVRRAAIVAAHARELGLTLEEFLTSTTYLREYMAEFVTETSRAIFPGFSEAREKSVTAAHRAILYRPLFVDRYVVIDVGGSRDPTGLLFSYWDFFRQRLVVEGERLLRNPTTKELAEALRHGMLTCFGPEARFRPETKTFIYVDGNDLLTQDLWADHKLAVAQTAKDDKEAAISTVRDWWGASKIEVNPECRAFLAQCRAGIWNKRHTEFERIEGFGHFDLVDCGIYTVRNVLPNVNRLPPRYGLSEQDHFFKPAGDERPALATLFEDPDDE